MQWEIYQNQYGAITSARIQTANITARVDSVSMSNWSIEYKCGFIEKRVSLKTAKGAKMEHILYRAAEILGLDILTELGQEIGDIEAAVDNSKEAITWRRHV